MKIPRVKDFDPNAKEVPVLKSSLDHMPAIQKPKTPDGEAKTYPVPPVRVVPLVRDVPYYSTLAIFSVAYKAKLLKLLY
jgi:hypothetical protein